MISNFLREKKPLLLLLSVLLVIFMAYVPVLRHEFVSWDDYDSVVNNELIRSLDAHHLQSIFTQKVIRTYIPLTILSYAFEYHFFGTRPFIYHLDNLLLHLIVVMLVFAFARRLGIAPGGAAIAALLFGIHPMRVESVAWVTARKDILYSLFYLVALINYVAYVKHSRKSSFVWTMIFSILSLLSKPMALSIPLVLLCCDWFLKRKITREVILEKVPLLVVTAVISWLTYTSFRFPGSFNFQEALLLGSWSFVFYLRQLILPVNIVPIHPIPSPVSWSNLEYTASALIIVLLVAALYRYKRARWFIFAFAFYFLSIFFRLGFQNMSSVLGVNHVADRFIYLPGLGFCLWFGVLFESMFHQAGQKNIFRKGLIGVCFLLIFAALAIKTMDQVGTWKNSITLWNHQLAYNPEDPIALHNLAAVLRKEPEFREAEETFRSVARLQLQGIGPDSLDPRTLQKAGKVDYIVGLYKKAISIEPGFAESYFNLANLYSDTGRTKDAIENYIKTLKVNPGYFEAYYRLGSLYQTIGDSQRAVNSLTKYLKENSAQDRAYLNVIKIYRRAVAQNPSNTLYPAALSGAFAAYLEMTNQRPHDSPFYVNLGIFYQEMGDYEQAGRAFRHALDLDLNDQDALYYLGNLYQQLGMPKEAISQYSRLTELNPRFPDAYSKLGELYGGQGQYGKSIEQYQRALAINSLDTNALLNIGLAYQAVGKYQTAIEHLEKLVKIDPNNALGHLSLGNLYGALGDYSSSKAAFKRTIEIRPDNGDAFFSLSLLSLKEGDFTGAIRYCDEARILGYDVPQKYLEQLDRYRNGD